VKAMFDNLKTILYISQRF